LDNSCGQCDQIGRNFAIWLLFTWAFSIFNLNTQFQNMLGDTWFNIQKQFGATIILRFDYLATVLATFLKIGRFFFNFLVTLPGANVIKFLPIIYEFA
jgi:hypothetical protein